MMHKISLRGFRKSLVTSKFAKKGVVGRDRSQTTVLNGDII